MRSVSLRILTAGVALLLPLWAQSTRNTDGQHAGAAKSQAQSWTGALEDAGCKATNPNEKCEISATTKAFGIQTADGKHFKLDDEGNAKVRAALQAQHKDSGDVTATLAGSMEGDMIRVAEVRIH